MPVYQWLILVYICLLYYCYFIYQQGVGGGYCERENVEYIDRTESDDEIDEVCMNDFSIDNIHVALLVWT
jgi:hypothetical protein